VAACLLAAAATRSDAAYSRRWYAIAGGGVTPVTPGANGYRLSGTIGQPVVAVRKPGSYLFVTGFWSGPNASAYVGVPGDSPLTGAPFRVASPVPNPSRGSAMIAFELAAPVDCAVQVFDSQGRRIRALARDHRSAGLQRVTWDGRDDSGAMAPRGIYFVHVDAGAQHGVTRLALLSDGGVR
jgi:hypothetical protein